jgi:hypothetical protein
MHLFAADPKLLLCVVSSSAKSRGYRWCEKKVVILVKQKRKENQMLNRNREKETLENGAQGNVCFQGMT